MEQTFKWEDYNGDILVAATGFKSENSKNRELNWQEQQRRKRWQEILNEKKQKHEQRKAS